MYRIMLADDEGIVTNSLSFVLNKNFQGQFDIETVKSGRGAIETAEHFRPDIIFMDIQMPGINGIEAMKEIRTFLPNAIFIVLTAYDKFDYAKESINLGVLEYLNKPFNQKSIIGVVEQAINVLDERRAKRSQDLENKEKLETVIPIIENGFISSVLFHETYDEELDNYKNLLGLGVQNGFMLAVIFGENQKDGHMTNVVGTSVKAQTKFYSKVREIIKSIFPDAIVGNIISNKIPVFIGKDAIKTDYDERNEIIEQARAAVREMRSVTDISYRIGIGGIKRLRDCSESYDEALKALYASEASVAHVDDLPITASYEESYPADLEKAIFDKLADGDADQCLIQAGLFYDWMAEKYSDDIMSIKLKALEFVLRAESDMYKNGGYIYTFESRKDYLSEIMASDDVATVKNWYLEKIRLAASQMTTGGRDHTHYQIKKALELIESNYHKDISLDEISETLNISPYYFSKLFKENQGEGFIEYLTRKRIDKAKLMLTDPEKSIKEIGIACGYSDPNYFSRIFKKSTGMTPSEYKEKL
ncbi:MAG: helix-turn-helix domain-containing protein [Lachnospiraceae bacterium]|nr:helix-turn-helix domain-containing protein [Lachnospiraceae bacterium]